MERESFRELLEGWTLLKRLPTLARETCELPRDISLPVQAAVSGIERSEIRVRLRARRSRCCVGTGLINIEPRRENILGPWRGRQRWPRKACQRQPQSETRDHCGAMPRLLVDSARLPRASSVRTVASARSVAQYAEAAPKQCYFTNGRDNPGLHLRRGIAIIPPPRPAFVGEKGSPCEKGREPL
jgi:hypothetical protein